MKTPRNFNKWLAFIYPAFEKFTVASTGVCYATAKEGNGKCHLFLTAPEVKSHVATFKAEMENRKKVKQAGYKLPALSWLRK